ncbi:MAG: AMP-binding protein [Clostridiaceae bacterium]|nr:AMP-binding protein [Clostridiaceae bacterium]
MTVVKGKAYYDMPEYKDIPDMFSQSVRMYKDQYVVTYRNNPQDEPIDITYLEMSNHVNALCQIWSDLDLTNKRVAILGANSYQWIISYFAAATCQNLVIPLDNLLKIDEIVSLLERSESDILCVDLMTFLKFTEIDDFDLFNNFHLIQVMNKQQANSKSLEKFEALKEKIETQIDNCQIIYSEDLIEQGKILADQKKPIIYEKQDPETPTVLIFTSGTTDMAKGVLLTQKALVTDVSLLHGIVYFPEKLRSLSLLPLNHTFESTCGMLAVISLGGHIHIYDGLRYVQKNLQEYQIQMLIAVPAIFESFYNRIQQQIKKQNKEKTVKFALSLSRFLLKFGIDIRRKLFKDILEGIGNLELAIVGAAAMKKEQLEFFNDIGIRILEGYGLTETAPVCIANNDFVYAPGTIGQPLPKIEAKVDTDVPGEPGELMIRGPIVMTGYYKNEQATKEVLSADGWFRTGDLATLDPKTNYFTITGRKKSMIVLDNGKKIFPEEIENLIRVQGHAIIKDMMVFNQKAQNDQMILSIKFVLNKIDDSLPSDEEIREFLDELISEINSKIPNFKRIKSYFYSYRDMISTSTLKVKREEERKRIENIKKKLELRWDEINRRNIDTFEAQLS